jgi:putative transcriptional regulator
MPISYNKLWKMMIDKDMSKTQLTHLAGISTNAMAKLGKGEDVRVNVLEKLCTSLDCKLDDIVEFVPDSKKPDSKR